MKEKILNEIRKYKAIGDTNKRCCLCGIYQDDNHAIMEHPNGSTMCDYCYAIMGDWKSLREDEELSVEDIYNRINGKHNGVYRFGNDKVLKEEKENER